ncbi:hydroxymethylglutaryl-CoA lyase [Hugenholtzia roseola]|uniref:hydroxymethylglutaryl-CoA lyase n=1 Tax=Hugenholtzia roseola TaxID=1002 RepID=UPI0003F6A51C|nr:hydroxymethylglutaryl-CoA lyase [Hugenholtzia roseola]
MSAQSTPSRPLLITECPRDAMQGIKTFIPTSLKAAYLNALLKVGFPVLDFGSFVSARAIPQMRDTAEVLDLLDLSPTQTKLLAIVAGEGGLKKAAQYPQVHYLGFPLSISEEFQRRNTEKSIEEALDLLDKMQDVCYKTGKELVVYVSMAFGNPYGEPYQVERVTDFVYRLERLSVQSVQLSDTIGVAQPQVIRPLFESLIKEFPHISFGSHFHSNPNTAEEKIAAAYLGGCRNFDGAMGGFGGCPMAKDELTGNIATEKILAFAQSQNFSPAQLGLDEQALQKAIVMVSSVFPQEEYEVIK